PLYIHVRNKAKAELGNFKVYVYKFTRGILNLVNSDKLDIPEVVDFSKEVQEKDQRIKHTELPLISIH
ncbi:12422_t:CDS:1, partial [Funneliformis caledonium]